MRISILCTDDQHPVVKSLDRWTKEMNAKGHDAKIFFDKSKLVGGDFLFLVSCAQVLNDFDRQRYTHVLVLHASDLPSRRGWSPHIWAILDGENHITVSLLEAANQVDTGRVWLKKSFLLEGHELLDEINEKLFKLELNLMTDAVMNADQIQPTLQIGDPGEYMNRRVPNDSQIDPHKSISKQFNLLRIADPQRHPAFFEYLGVKYFIKIEKDKSGPTK